MLIKDIKDAERYLENDCYCKYEIYDSTGFSYRLFKPEEECELIVEGKEVKQGVLTVIVAQDQLVVFGYEDDKIVFSERYDATENNIAQVKAYFNHEIDRIVFDRFEKDSTTKALKEIMDIADVIMID